MEFPWTAPDGIVFACEQWLPVGEARGVLLCVHGMGGAATDFIPMAEVAARAGLAVFAINLRGQGRDPDARRRGLALDLTAIEADLTAFGAAAVALFPGRPVFWCGESMGALIVSHVLSTGRWSQPVAGAIFSVPVVELRRRTPAPVRAILRVVARLWPSLRFKPSLFVSGKAEPLRITRDEDFSRQIRESAHFIPAFSIGFLDALGNLMESNRAIAAGVRLPSLVLAAGNDVFIRTEQVEAWYRALAAEDKELKVYPEAYHVLWNDWDREKVLEDVLDWLERRL